MTRLAAESAPLPSPWPASARDALVSLLRGNWTYFPSLCWRRDLVTSIGFRPRYGVVLDLGLLLDVLASGGDLLVLPGTHFRYRRHANSASSLEITRGGLRAISSSCASV